MGRGEPFNFALQFPPNNSRLEVILMAKKKSLVSLIIAYESGELSAAFLPTIAPTKL
jgi:hypothetical protein